MAASPRHIAFILDGNRRWAKKVGIPQLLGHKRGYEKADALTRYASKYGIKYLTYYVFSTENWNRSREEVGYLMDLFRDMFSANSDFFQENDIRVIAIGNIEKLPNDIINKLKNLEEKTKNNTGLVVSIAISYSSRDEITRAAKKISNSVLEGKLSIDDITEDVFASYLDTKDVPDPDLIVRTKEQRLSNFLLWQTAYSEIVFLDKLWPEFEEEDLKFVLEEFSKRSRRYGR